MNTQSPPKTEQIQELIFSNGHVCLPSLAAPQKLIQTTQRTYTNSQGLAGAHVLLSFDNGNGV